MMRAAVLVVLLVPAAVIGLDTPLVMAGSHLTEGAFVTTWNVTASPYTVSIPVEVHTGGTLTIDWGDNVITTVNTNGTQSHTYSASDEYQVSMTGDLSRIIPSATGGTPSKLASIDQWGDIEWSSMERAFQHTTNMKYNASDVPNLSGVSSMDSMFHFASKFDGDLSEWNVSAVTDMHHVFIRASSFNGNVSTWNVSAVTDMNSMFNGASSFNGDISIWNVSAVTDMGSMFSSASDFNGDISSWNVSAVTDMDNMFNGASSFNGDISGWDVSDVILMFNMFSGAFAFNGDISDWDVSAVTNMNRMFNGAFAFNQPLNSWNVSSVTNMFYMFQRAFAFDQPLNDWDVSAVLHMDDMFLGASDFKQNLGSWYVVPADTDYDAATETTLVVTAIAAQNSFLDDPTPNYGIGTGGDSELFSMTGSDLVFKSAPSARVYTVNVTAPGGDFGTNNHRVLDITVEGQDDSTVSADAFVTTWNVTASTYTISIPVRVHTGGTLTIDWGDGTAAVEVTTNGTQSHTYSASGEYQVSMTGDLSRIILGAPGGTSDNLASIDQWGDIEWSSMQDAFRGASNMEYHATDAPNLSRVISMQNMFRDASSFNGNLSDWNVSTVTNMDGTFRGASDFNGDVSSWDTSSATDMRNMFQDADNFDGDISGWDVSKVTDTSSMFYKASDFNQPLNSWDVSKVTDMSSMFYDADSFNQPLNGWDVSKVTDMSFMFFGTAFFDGDLTGWNVSKVTDMSSMFYSASSFDRPLDSWDVSSVTEMNSMFDSADSFNRPLNSWNVSAVTDMFAMFRSTDFFDGDISGWDVSKVTDMSRMFSGAFSFNGDISGWDVSKVTNMDSMFSSVTDFKQNLGKWYVVPVDTVYDAATEITRVVTAIAAQNSFLDEHFPNYGIGTGGDFALFSMTGSNLVFKSTPPSAGTYTVNVTASGSNVFENGNNWRTLTVTVTGQEDRPLLVDAGPDQRVLDESEVTLLGTVSDSDSTNLTYLWTQNPGSPAVTLADSDKLTSTFTAPDVSSDVDLIFTLTVDDGTDTVTDTVTVTVHDAEADFVTTWSDITLGINIPIRGPAGSFTVDWGDGEITEYATIATDSNLRHNYDTSGTYTIHISGNFSGIYLHGNSNTAGKLQSIDQWGDIEWTTMAGAFYFASNMIYNATDVPDLSSVTDMSHMFYTAGFSSGDLSGWDVSGVTDMRNMFASSGYTGDLSGWNVSSVTYMQSMFSRASSFDSDLSGWDVSAANNMDGMFFDATSFDSDLSGWDVSAVLHMDDMFDGATSFEQNLGEWYILPAEAAYDITDASLNVTVISAQNSILDGHNPTYGIDPDDSHDSGLFSMTGSTLMFKVTPSTGDYKVNVTASGSGVFESGNNWRTLTVTVTGQEDRPLLVDAGPDQRVLDGSTVKLQGIVSGITDPMYSWTQNSGSPAVTLAGSDTPTPTFTAPPVSSDVDLVFTLTVRDGTETVTDTVTVTVHDAEADFVITWGDTGTGINLPIRSSAGSFTVDWGDGEISKYAAVTTNKNLQHIYDIPGTYTIRISGNFSGISWQDNQSLARHLQSIDQWGDIEWTTMAGAFTSASNMIYNATDVPDLSSVTDMSHMFRSTDGFSSGDLSGWNVSGVTDMRNMFSSSSYTGDLSSWDVSSVTYMQNMFSRASSFNSDLSGWNVSAVNNMDGMFFRASSFNSDLSGWNVSSVASMQNMFLYASSFNSDLSGWNVSAVLRMNDMFSGATSFEQNLGPWYIVLDSDTISYPTQTLDIMAQNLFLGMQNPVYGLGMGGDSDLFVVNATAGTLGLNPHSDPSPPPNKIYQVNVTSTGSFGTANHRTVEVTVDNADPAVTPPTFDSSELNTVTGVLRITFSETIDVTPAANIVPTKIHIRESGNYTGGITLSAVELGTTSDDATISFTLTSSHLTTVAGLNSTELTIEPGAVQDTFGNLIDGTFDASTAVFVNATSIKLQDTAPYGIAFSNNGTKMFVVGDYHNNINQYTLSIAFDISTAYYDGNGERFTALQDTSPRGMAFSNDGLKMFVVGYTNKNINQYALSPPFDVSTANFTTATSSPDNYPRGIAFSNNGTKMFVVSSVKNAINQYTLSNAFDLSTVISVTHLFDVSTQDTYPKDMAFSNDGAKMFVVGSRGEAVNEYTLSPAFDVSTANFTTATSIASQDGDPAGMAFSNDGTKMFVVGNHGDDVNEYALSSVYPITVTDTVAPDTTPPTLSLTGNTSVTISVGTTYNDEGATCEDAVDGTIIPTVVSNTVDTTQVGTYAVTYSCTDAANNPAIQVTRTVTVEAAPDTTPPTLSLTGNTSVTISVGTTYNDEGATCEDAVDGTIIPTVVSDTVDTTQVGTYAVTYSCTDAANNPAIQVTRTVTVEAAPDTTPPTLSLTGNTSVTISVGTTYNDEGATCEDAVDGTIIPTVVSDTVDTTQVGTYAVTYSCTDAANNPAIQVTRTVTVEAAPDTTPPTLSLTGNTSVTISVGTTYNDEGATCEDAVDGTIIPTVVSDTVDTTQVGTYAVTYSCTDAANNPAIQVTRTVTVEAAPDTTPPTLSLTGNTSVTISVGTTYNDEGATCEDAVDGTIIPTVVSNTVDTTQTGTYAVTYSCTDAANNPAIQVTRTVTVEAAPDTTPPTLSLTGNTSVTISVGTTYNDEGATCEDAVDGTIIPTVVSNTVDTTQTGTYAVTYSCTDAANNPAIQVTRTVTVEAAPDTTPPTLSLTGNTSVTISVGTTYNDEGATCEDAVDGTIIPTVVSNTVDTTQTGTYAVTYSCTDAANNPATQVSRTVIVQTAVTPDTTPPTLSLTGNTSVTISVGTTYNDEGATCEDAVDGTIIPTVVSNTVDTTQTGTYAVTYSCTDAANNPAIQVTRTVTVEAAPDTTPPTLSLTGNTSVTISVGTTYNDEGATCEDAVDGTIIPTVVSNTVDTTQTGTYAVTYSCTDAANNPATQVSRTVIVQTAVTPDTTPPTLSLTGNTSVTISVGTTYNDEGATCEDAVDGTIIPTVVSNTVDTTQTGTYAVTYSCTDAANNPAIQVTRTVTVEAAPDTTPPTLSLTGNTSVTISVGTTYNDEGATCEDAVDGTIIPTVVSNTVDTTQVGTYAVIYSCTDAANNPAIQVTRTVTVEAAPDTTPPTLSLTGNTSVTISVGTTYNDEGATCEDAVDGTIIPTVVSNTVDTTQVGTYAVTYSCTDAAGNDAIPVDRIVTVTDRANTAPVAEAGPHLQVDEGKFIILRGSGSDVDNDVLTYSWSQDSRLSFDNRTSATPTVTASSVTIDTPITLTLTVDDGTTFNEDTMILTILEVTSDNLRPTVSVGSGQTVKEGVQVSMPWTASDPDGDALTYLWSQSPGQPAIFLESPGQSPTTFTTPQVDDDTEFTFTLTVTAGPHNADDSLTITVKNNHSPTVDAGNNRTVNEGVPVTLSGIARDLDDDPLTYEWTIVSGPAPTDLTGDNMESLQFTAPGVAPDEDIVFRFTATDDSGEFAEDTVTITVRDVPITVSSATYNPGSGTLLITFNQDIATVDYSRLHVRSANSDIGGITLFNAVSKDISSNDRTITVVLDSDMKEMYADLTSPHLVVEDGAITDIDGDQTTDVPNQPLRDASSNKRSSSPPPVVHLSALAQARIVDIPAHIAEQISSRDDSDPLEPLMLDDTFDFPLVINGYGYLLDDVTNTLVPQIVTVGDDDPTVITFTVYTQKDLAHFTLYLNLSDENTDYTDSDTYITYKNDGTAVVTDPHGYIADATITVTQEDDSMPEKKTVSITLYFDEPMGPTNMVAYMWNTDRKAAFIKIIDAFEVTAVLPESVIQTADPEPLEPNSELPADPEPSSELPADPEPVSTDTLGPDDYDDAQVLHIIRMWSGFESEFITDEQMLASLGLDYPDADIPDWVMTELGVLAAKGDVTVDEFMLALQYVLENL